MNYNVMKRPMFKMGGKAASQGTGITSGLDEKVNMAIGGGVIKGDNLGTREGFQQPNLSGMSLEDLINLQQQNYNKQMSGLSDMRDIVRLQTLGNLATNVLPNIERGGLTGVVDFLKDPMTTQQAISGLTGLKRVDLKEKELKGKGLDQFIKGKIALKKLDIDEQRALVQTATQLKLKAGEDSRALLQEYGSVDKMPAKQKQEFYDLRTILGDLSPSKARQLAIKTVEDRNKDFAETGAGRVLKPGTPEYSDAIELLTEEYLKGFNFADGGRVNRRMGSDDDGELPPDPTEPINPFKPKPIKPLGDGKMDVAMETQGRGNQVFDMLRARLPQEITDDVVQLISYNKEAFADFASIKNQEDVTSFNEKYGVQLVIDVATV